MTFLQVYLYLLRNHYTMLISIFVCLLPFFMLYIGFAGIPPYFFSNIVARYVICRCKFSHISVFITQFYYSIYAGIFLLFHIFDSICHVGAYTSLCHKIYTLFPTAIVYIYVIAAIVFTMIIFSMLFIAEQWLSQVMLLVACNRREATSYYLRSS